MSISQKEKFKINKNYIDVSLLKRKHNKLERCNIDIITDKLRIA